MRSLNCAGRQVGRWLRPVRALATWAFAALVLASGCAWQVVGSRPAAQADVAFYAPDKRACIKIGAQLQTGTHAVVNTFPG